MPESFSHKQQSAHKVGVWENLTCPGFPDRHSFSNHRMLCWQLSGCAASSRVGPLLQCCSLHRKMVLLGSSRRCLIIERITPYCVLWYCEPQRVSPGCPSLVRQNSFLKYRYLTNYGFKTIVHKVLGTLMKTKVINMHSSWQEHGSESLLVATPSPCPFDFNGDQVWIPQLVFKV